MAYYTCPKCQSTYELRAGMTHCPACLAPIRGHENDIPKEFGFFKDEEQSSDNEIKEPLELPNEPVKAPAYKDMSFTPVDESATSGDEGSYLVGFVLAFFLSWIGLIIAAVMQKRKTLKGAIITFFVQLGLEIIFLVILYVTGFFKQFQEALLEGFPV